MTATSALTTATASLPAPAPGASPPGNPAAVAVPAADDEVLSVDELLQLLEQGAGFAQALAAAGAPVASPGCRWRCRRGADRAAAAQGCGTRRGR